MPLRLRRARRDPFWGMDGPAARSEHLRARLMGMIAFSYSVVAAAIALMAWGIQLGLADASGLRLMVMH